MFSKPLLRRLIAYPLLLLGLWFLAPRMLEKQFIFFPTRDISMTPADLGLAYEHVHFSAADGTALRGWLVRGQPSAPVVLFCMGNYGNMSHRVGNLTGFHRLGLNVFIFDYRGYGQSSGRISEAGTYMDVRGAVDWLAEQGWSPQQTIYFGRSLGAAVALQAAIENPAAGVVLETPFTSIAAMGRTHYPLLYLLLGWLVDARYDNLEKISALKSSLLILHGDRDRICPPEMAQQLFDQAPHPKRLFWIPGADHNNTLERGGEAYWEVWRDFLAESIDGPVKQEIHEP